MFLMETRLRPEIVNAMDSSNQSLVTLTTTVTFGVPLLVRSLSSSADFADPLLFMSVATGAVVLVAYVSLSLGRLLFHLTDFVSHQPNETKGALYPILSMTIVFGFFLEFVLLLFWARGQFVPVPMPVG